ncbi:TIR domain-containing protein [Halomonas pacifica]|uniref:TIR domain-containing protein n=1 Tax=Bisbaumannia pacifica TaxID=77098 RepID=UPI002359DDF2|nr:TIR domain-containing protein [Halomonas pacifica]MDC8802778.1 TIR domain-containing protein [Halomonas pacifica]
MSSESKNVFISHVHKDDEGLTDLKALLKSKGMEVRDSSINSDRPNDAKSPEYIKSHILAPRISWASTMIVYISPETKNSEWVNWEIERAHKEGKTVIGVWERGAKDCEIPEALDDYGHALVGWNAERIIDAVNGVYEKFETPDGDPSGPRPISRHPCG